MTRSLCFHFCLLLLTACALGQTAGECTRAQADLEGFLAGLPHSCRTDADCDGYYYRVDSCAAPLVLQRPGVPKAREPQLLRRQAAVREKCSTELAKHGPCEARPFRAACIQHACLDTLSSPPPPTAQDPDILLGFHTAQCAPWDGPAVGFYVGTEKLSCGDWRSAILQISVFVVPVPSGKTISFPGTGSTPDAMASRCPAPGKCQPAKRGSITFDKVGTDKVSGSYDLEFYDGTRERGRFKTTLCKQRVTVCG